MSNDESMEKQDVVKIPTASAKRLSSLYRLYPMRLPAFGVGGGIMQRKMLCHSLRLMFWGPYLGRNFFSYETHRCYNSRHRDKDTRKKGLTLEIGSVPSEMMYLLKTRQIARETAHTYHSTYLLSCVEHIWDE